MTESLLRTDEFTAFQHAIVKRLRSEGLVFAEGKSGHCRARTAPFAAFPEFIEFGLAIIAQRAVVANLRFKGFRHTVCRVRRFPQKKCFNY